MKFTVYIVLLFFSSQFFSQELKKTNIESIKNLEDSKEEVKAQVREQTQVETKSKKKLSEEIENVEKSDKEMVFYKSRSNY